MAPRSRGFLGILIVGRVTRVETIAQGRGIRELERLERTYGPGRWRKRKGIARVRLPDGSTGLAELHWYEARGIGRREFKLKHLIEEPR